MNWSVIFGSAVVVIIFILIAMERAYISNKNSLPAYYEKYLQPISVTVILLLALGFCSFFVYDIQESWLTLFRRDALIGLAIGVALIGIIIGITTVISLKICKEKFEGQGIKNKYIFCAHSISNTLVICTFFTLFTRDITYHCFNDLLYMAVKWLVFFPLVLCGAYWLIKKRVEQIKIK